MLLRENTVLLTLQKSVLFALSQSLERENKSGWKICNSYKQRITNSDNSFETVSNVKGYHVYQSIWVPKIGETLSTER